MPPNDTIRYLSGADVAAAMPSMEDQLRLAERTLRALTEDADLPAKIGVHPRPQASFGHAMPAWLRGTELASILLGIKWVTGFPANREVGRPAISATLLLSDATTGELRAVMDAGGITARRTAAVSGVVVRQWAPAPANGSLCVGIVGAGVQGESHVAMLATALPGSRVRIHDVDAERAEALAARARALEAFREVASSADAAETIAGSDVVITLVSFGPQRQLVPAAAFERAGLVVAVDYDMCVPASVARDSALFVVDELAQFLANRTGTVFADYPDSAGIIGARLDDARPDGRVVVSHLGVGLADVVFGDAILRTALRRDLGTSLSR